MASFFQLVVYLMLGFAASYCAIVLVLRPSSRHSGSRRQQDFHHGRADRRQYVPRLGGIGLAAAFVAILAVPLEFLFPTRLTPEHWTIAVTSLAMFALGLCDDLRALGAKRKLLGQLIISIVAFYLGIGIYRVKIPLTGEIIPLGFMALPVTVLWLVAMTNLINLVDGADGLAGGISLMLMSLIAVVGGSSGSVPILAAGMAGALLGFLRFNFPPARIYLGDGGAYFVGFLIGAFTVASSQKGTIVAALIAPLFVLALPILDTSLAILRRGLQGLPLLRADRRHIHHRLLESGLSPRAVTLWAYAFTACFLMLGFAVFWGRGMYYPLAIGTALLVMMLAAGMLNFSREWFAVGRVLGNSLGVRTDIQYALAQTRWLVLEGYRSHSIESLCEDTAFIARKLGFVSMKVQLRDGQRSWRMGMKGERDGRAFRHSLPGHPSCFIDLYAPAEIGMLEIKLQDLEAKFSRVVSPTDHKFSLMGDLLAEGWGKAVVLCARMNRLPVRFDPIEDADSAAAEGAPELAIIETAVS